MQEGFAPLPIGRNAEGADVGTHRIGQPVGQPVFGNFAQNVRRVEREGVDVVGVERRAVALQLPVRRDGDGVPRRAVKVFLKEILWPLVWCRHPVEAPRAIKRPDVGRLFAIARHCVSAGFIRNERCARGFLADAENLRVFPVLARGKVCGQQPRAQRH